MDDFNFTMFQHGLVKQLVIQAVVFRVSIILPILGL